MAKIIAKNGNNIIKVNNGVGLYPSCCCGEPPSEPPPSEPPPPPSLCVEKYNFPCKITVIHIDENRCEDDVFDILILGKNNRERFIRELDLVSKPRGCCDGFIRPGLNPAPGGACPQTTIEFTIDLQEDDFQEFFGSCVTSIIARFKKANCCSTFTRIIIIGSNGNIIFGNYFGPAGYLQQINAGRICTEKAPPP